MVECPLCDREGGLESFKQLREPWRFRFYTVKMLECPKCRGVFNYHGGVSPRGRYFEFTTKVSPR